MLLSGGGKFAQNLEQGNAEHDTRVREKIACTLAYVCAF